MITLVILFLFSLVVGYVISYLYLKQKKATARLRNIHGVAQNLFDGEYGEEGRLAALSFILCESNLSLIKGRRKK